MPRFTAVVLGTVDEIGIAVAIIIFIGSMLNKIDIKIPGIDEDGEGPLRLVCRIEWNAAAPTQTIEKLDLPVEHVVISHTASGVCNNKEICMEQIKNLQTFQMVQKGLSDIPFNFLIGGDVRVYVGRGWYNQSGLEPANLEPKNLKPKKTIEIAFIGSYNSRRPSIEMLQMGQKLISETISMGKIAEDYKLYGERELYETESPGELLFQLIQKWPNYCGLTPIIDADIVPNNTNEGEGALF